MLVGARGVGGGLRGVARVRERCAWCVVGGVGKNKARVNERVCYHAEPRRRLDQVCYHAPRAGVLPRTAGVCVIVTYLTGPLFGRGRYPPHG